MRFNRPRGIGEVWVVGVPVLFPLQERSQSEGRAKAERRHSGGILHVVCGVLCQPSVIVIPKKAKIRVPLSEEKSGTKWDMMTMTITIGMRALLPHGG